MSRKAYRSNIYNASRGVSPGSAAAVDKILAQHEPDRMQSELDLMEHLIDQVIWESDQLRKHIHNRSNPQQHFLQSHTARNHWDAATMFLMRANNNFLQMRIAERDYTNHKKR